MRYQYAVALGVAVGIAAALWRNAPAISAALEQIGPKWRNLHPAVKARAQRVLDAAQAEFAADGLRVAIFDGWRDPAEQAKHMKEGASWVNAALDSFHVWGLAVDFVFLDSLGRWTWLEGTPGNGWDKWHRLGALIEREGFEWGGRWQRRDGPHAQASDIDSPARLRLAYGDPWDYINRVVHGVA